MNSTFLQHKTQKSIINIKQYKKKQVFLIRAFIVSTQWSDTVAPNKMQTIAIIINNSINNKYQNCLCIDLPRIKNILNILEKNTAVFSFGKNS